jgi:hypothetical protein
MKAGAKIRVNTQFLMWKTWKKLVKDQYRRKDQGTRYKGTRKIQCPRTRKKGKE